MKIAKWVARIMSLTIILFGLPFYFGYGNPLPFSNPENSFVDNIWLAVFPLVFIGLALGWKWAKIGGYIVTVSIFSATIIGIILTKGLPGPMFIPMTAGVLYIVSDYLK